MHNITTIYRFNTPFLDIESEKNGLLNVGRKIEKSLEFDGIKFEKTSAREGDYYKITLNFLDNLGKIDLFYISDLAIDIYHLPIFKLDLFLNQKFLSNNELKQKAVKFLTNLFECFDGLNEKEYLIDLNNDIYYTSGFFRSKNYPHYDFSNLEKIQKDFEDKKGIQLLENFIVKFQNKSYVLTRENANEYHKLHGIFLYFIYLVFIMSQNLEKSKNTKENLEKFDGNGIYEGHITMIKKRLNYVDNLNRDTFEKYQRRLELFFKMF